MFSKTILSYEIKHKLRRWFLTKLSRLSSFDIPFWCGKLLAHLLLFLNLEDTTHCFVRQGLKILNVIWYEFDVACWGRQISMVEAGTSTVNVKIYLNAYTLTRTSHPVSVTRRKTDCLSLSHSYKVGVNRGGIWGDTLRWVTSEAG